jgi:hypothetical protein
VNNAPIPPAQFSDDPGFTDDDAPRSERACQPARRRTRRRSADASAPDPIPPDRSIPTEVETMTTTTHDVDEGQSDLAIAIPPARAA